MEDASPHRRAPNHHLGALLGIFTAVFTAGFLLCFRAAASHAERSTITFALLLGAAIFNSGATVVRWRVTPRPDRIWVVSALVLGMLSVVGNWALATVLPMLGPGLTSTMMQLQIFFVSLGAWVFLQESVSRSLLAGAVIAVAGFAVFTLSEVVADLSVTSLALAVVPAMAFGAMLVWTRGVIDRVDPISLNAGRLWLAAAAMALWPGMLGAARTMSWTGWGLSFAAAACGPFAARVALMYSLRYISAAQSKLWSMLSPVFAFLFVFLLYGDVPSVWEVLGGGLIVTGVLLPTAMRAMRD